VSIISWGELPAERKMPGVLRVLVADQAAGAIERTGGSWAAADADSVGEPPLTRVQADRVAAILAPLWPAALRPHHAGEHVPSC
jgi:hypothetical protein